MIAALLLAAGAVVLPQTPAQWQQAATNDIDAAYQLTLDNHPGTYDPANPGFAENLAEARKAGLALAAQVRDGAGYQAAVARFNNRIHDGHAGIEITTPTVAQWRWPGFVTVWRGDSMHVYASVPGGPEAGSKVVSCDGKPIADLAQSNVFAFWGRSEEGGSWWEYARDVFIDAGNPFIKLPDVCTFAAAGKSYSVKLAWSPFNDQATRWRQQSYNGDVQPVSLREPRPRLFWAALPEFNPNEAQRADYRAIADELRDHREYYLQADAFVIDLRGNHGGSSAWPRDFAAALWGDEALTQRDKQRLGKQQVWWRTSPGNLAHMRWLAGYLQEQKQTDIAAGLRASARQMQAAQERGERYWVTGGANEPAPKAPPPPVFNRPVYVIVPGQCASACLDALDYFTLFQNTTLIGAPSAADSTYMEVRYQPLPSGLARAVIPNKMYVGRPRAAGQFYTPQIVVNDLEWSSANFLKVIEADLAKR